MVDIIQTIMSKIEISTLMVADITPVGKTKHEKLLPNPNVLIELGYALRSVGDKRVIAIMNEGYGDEVGKLPFDLSNRRVLCYTLSANANKNERRITRKKTIEKFVDAIKTNLAEFHQEQPSVMPEIRGAEPHSEMLSVWKSEWPVEYTGYNGSCKITPSEEPRAWTRIIP